jgi:large subunit ribosomal protein L10
MPKTRIQKKVEVDKIEEKIARAKSIIFTSYAGLDVSGLEELRGKFREGGVEYKAASKNLLNIALDNAKIEHDDITELDGSIGAAFSLDDEVSAAKVANDFSKTNENFAMRSGILKIGDEWKFLSEAEVMNLANLPSRDELLAKVVGSINAPISGFVNVLAGNLRGLVNVLSAIKDTK